LCGIYPRAGRPDHSISPGRRNHRFWAASETLRVHRDARRRRPRQGPEHPLDAVDDAEEVAAAGPGETAADDRVDQVEQGPPVAAYIGDHDRLVVQSELSPGDDLQGLVEG